MSEGSWTELEAFCAQARMPLVEALRHIGFRAVFTALTANAKISDPQWVYLQTFCAKAEISLEVELRSVRDMSRRMINRQVASLVASEEISAAQEQAIYQLADRLQIPAYELSAAKHTIGHARRLADIRRGQIPVVGTRAMLRAGEQCYWDADATYIRQLSRGPTTRAGRLIITNQRVIFVAAQAGFEFPIKRIVQVSQSGTGMYIQLSRQLGAGQYYLQEHDVVIEILRTLVRVQNRRFTATRRVRSRHIPDEVKAAVWQRDGGRCVRCGATLDLEFDHIIPFSKGGANTVDNVQVLCRRCNRAKRDSI